MKLISFAAFVAVACAAVDYTPKQLGAEITDLPGKPAEATFKMFSGYIPIDAAETKKIFYWFVEAEESPETAPVTLWTNGGPGCSGMSGFMTEMGPFRPQEDGTLKMNPYAWTSVSNMLFIEQPAGVGFSTAPSGMQYGDDQSALDNYNFVVNWFKEFPQYATSDFYTTSESYGGHYMPTLAREMINRGGVPNYKGFAVGNPLTYMPYRDYGQYGTMAYHQLVPKPILDKYLGSQCDKDDLNPVCEELMGEIDALTANMDPYALDFPVCADSELSAGRHSRHAMVEAIKRAHHSSRGDLEGYFPDKYEPCVSDWASDYLNRADVQQAIHVENGPVQWGECNMNININYNIDDVNAPMMPVYKELIDSGKGLKILIFSGDNDAICATLGTQQFIWDLGYRIKSDWTPWTFEGQTAGFVTKFDGFNFATVHGAGHMVPSTRPAQGLQLFKDFLAGNL